MKTSNQIANEFKYNGFCFGSSLVELLKKNELCYTRNVASTGTYYIGVTDNNGEEFKIRIANHGKGYINYAGRETDANFIYDENTTELDFADFLQEELPSILITSDEYYEL